MNFTCDLFCTVIDNYGDIGVCWRLARQLAAEGVAVRLWVDDLASFARLYPAADPALEEQMCGEVRLRRWGREVGWRSLSRPDGTPLPQVGTEAAGVADLVIEAFACELPSDYVAEMAAKSEPPVWINLEYLSAEDWVEGCHGLPSPHPVLPLTKYFFFPGFTPRTGGLLLERDLLARRDAFLNDAQAMADYWQSFGLPAPLPDELRISLFGYENAGVTELLQVWSEGAVPVTCLVPEGRILPQVANFFEASVTDGNARVGQVWQRSNLRVAVLPFVEQERYDYLLWACDVNFVRGEDSCIRAQWAAKPFIWQIYPQEDGAHLEKLQAFLWRYSQGLEPEVAFALADMWQAWNAHQGTGASWQALARQREALGRHAVAWSAQLAGNSLALNLLDFCRKAGKMRAFEFSPSLNSFKDR